MCTTIELLLLGIWALEVLALDRTTISLCGAPYAGWCSSILKEKNLCVVKISIRTAVASFGEMNHYNLVIDLIACRVISREHPLVMESSRLSKHLSKTSVCV